MDCQSSIDILTRTWPCAGHYKSTALKKHGTNQCKFATPTKDVKNIITIVELCVCLKCSLLLCSIGMPPSNHEHMQRRLPQYSQQEERVIPCSLPLPPNAPIMPLLCENQFPPCVQWKRAISLSFILNRGMLESYQSLSSTPIGLTIGSARYCELNLVHRLV